MTTLSQYPDRGWDEPGRGWGPAPKKRGLGAGAKVALTLAGVVGGLGVLCAAALALLVAFGDRLAYGKEVKLAGGSQLFYTASVTDAEAQKLADYLNGYFKGADHPMSFQLNKKGGVYEVRMVVKDGMADNEAYVTLIQQWGREISEKVFDNAPVEMHLCDTSLKTLKVLPPEGPAKKA
jgi:hypothetical protein